MTLPAAEELRPLVGIVAACALVGQSRATAHRRAQPVVLGPAPRRTREAPASKLSPAEVAQVLAAVNSPRFAEASVAQTWATLLDEGTYWCSQSTMHRILRAAGAGGERRRQATGPTRARPELVASAPLRVWTWDITKIKGPARGVYYDLYVILDIFSRYVVGWRIETSESAQMATELIHTAITTHGAPQHVHADRGTSMTSKPVAQLLVDLGVTKSHSRPKVSNDNPYSEAQFKTLKYAPDFPDHFESLNTARAHCEAFFAYYNHEHRHSGLGLHTPASVHHGTAHDVRAQRQATLDAAYAAHPERFAHPPQAPTLPTAAWINQPTGEALIQSA